MKIHAQKGQTNVWINRENREYKQSYTEKNTYEKCSFTCPFI